MSADEERRVANGGVSHFRPASQGVWVKNAITKTDDDETSEHPPEDVIRCTL